MLYLMWKMRQRAQIRPLFIFFSSFRISSEVLEYIIY